MNQGMMVGNVNDERRSARVSFAGSVKYQCATDDKGNSATCQNVGHDGMCLRLGRYLKPGRRVLLDVSDSIGGTGQSELKAKVIWCRPAPSPCTFVAGIRVFHDDVYASGAMAELVGCALSSPEASGGVPPSRSHPARALWQSSALVAGEPFAFRAIEPAVAVLFLLAVVTLVS